MEACFGKESKILLNKQTGKTIINETLSWTVCPDLDALYQTDKGILTFCYGYRQESESCQKDKGIKYCIIRRDTRAYFIGKIIFGSNFSLQKYSSSVQVSSLDSPEFCHFFHTIFLPIFFHICLNLGFHNTYTKNRNSKNFVKFSSVNISSPRQNFFHFLPNTFLPIR